MKIQIQAMLNFGSKGAEKVKQLTDRIRENLAQSGVSAAKIDKGLFAPTANQNAGPGGDARRYRGQRGVTGARNASGRNFSGMASYLGGQDEGGGLVASYATIAANLFAITAAFTALSKAAQTEQLTKGLELMGARAGVALPPVAKNLQAITDNALSYADSMKVVAQATAAGFKTEEVERLAAVARGASVALGRDMSDSMDRLTRGTIKLEPELLDEIGIMTRLDEAVRVYALANDKTVSSLTQTERRQAFLNAVLEEGERKFGDVSKQIEANPYDKLSASLRDTGTAVLNVLNKALSPLANLLADMPGLAIAPLIFIITSAASKVLPNFANAWDKVGDRMNRVTDKIEYTKKLIANLNNSLLESAIEIESKISGGALNGIQGLDAKNLIGAPLDTKDIKDQIVNLDKVIQVKSKEAGFDQKQLQTLISIKEELRESLAIQRLIEVSKKNQAQEESKLRIQKIMNNRFESASVSLGQGQIFSAMGTVIGSVFSDLKNLGNATQTVGSRFAQLAAGALTAGRIIGSVISSLTLYFGIFIAAVQFGITIWENLGTAAEKAVRKAVKELKDYTDNIKETTKQLNLMLEPGKGESSKAFDAYRASLEQTEQKLREIILLKRAAEDPNGLGSESATRGVVTRNVRVAGRGMSGGEGPGREVTRSLSSIAQKNLNIEKEIADVLVARIALVETVNKKEAEKLRSLLMQKGTLDEVEKSTQRVLKKTLEVEGTYQSIGDSSRELGQAIDAWIPKEIDTPFSKANKELKDMISNIEKSGKGYTQVAEQFTLSLDQMEALLRVSKSLGVLTTTEITQLDKIVGAQKQILETEAEIQKIKEKREKTTNPAELLFLGAEVLLLERKKRALEKNLGKAVVEGTGALETAGDGIKTREDGLAILEKTIPLTNKRIEQDAELLKINREIVKIQDASSLASVSGGVSITRDKRLDALIELKNRKESLVNLKAENEVKKQTAANELEAAGARIAYEMKLSDFESKANRALVLKTSEYAQQQEIQRKQVEIGAAQVAKLEAEIAAQQALVASYNNEFAVQQRNLDLNNKKLDNLKEQAKLQNELTAASRTLENLKTTERALNQGSSVSQKELQKQQIDALKDQRDQMLRESEFAKIEYLAKMAQIDLERRVSIAELQQMQENDKANSASYQAIIDDTNRVRDTLNSTSDSDSIISTLTSVLGAEPSTVLSLMQKVVDAQVAVIDKQIDLASRDPQKDLLNNRRNNFTASLNNAFIPEQMRGYMEDQANDAGGWAKLVEDPQAYKNAVDLSKELATMDIIGQGLTNTFDAFYGGLTDAFAGLIDGSKSAKEAFTDLATGVLKAIAQMIAQMLAFRVVSSFMPGFGLPMGAAGGTIPAKEGAAGGIIGLANGGIMSRAAGGLQGIVKQPTYLVGEGRYNEAVVPLPNGRAIPVQMHGGNSATNNVQVNVNLSGNGSVQTETQGPDMNNLGSIIANAVQKELMAQKMPGGILNKYGAS